MTLVSEKKQASLVLIIDKKGILGERLAQRLFKEIQVVFVSEKEPLEDKVIWIPFENKPPVIPQGVYSNIFVFENEEKTREIIPSVFEKAIEDKADFVLIKNYREKEDTEILERKETKTIFLGDIVDKNVYGSIVNKVVNQANLRGKIEIPGEGMRLIYPVFSEDVIEGILRVGFGASRNKIFYVLPRDGITLLSFCHLLQKINPSIKLDFKGEENIEEIDFLGNASFLLPENYNLGEKIKSLRFEVPLNKASQENYKEEFYLKNKNKGSLRIISFFLMLFIFLPLISSLLFIILGKTLLVSGEKAISAFDFELAGKYTSTSEMLFGISKETSQLFLNETFGLGLAKELKKQSFENYEYAKGLTYLSGSVKLYSEGNMDAALSELKNFLLFSQKQEAKKNRLTFIPENVLTLIEGNVDNLPYVLGFEGEKKYLILFQNTSILRDQGGQVQAFGLLTIDKGKVKNFQTGTPEDIDSKVVGSLDPLFEERRYLGEKNLSFKESASLPDFITSASTSSYLFSLATKLKPDAVITVNPLFIKKLLSLTGPIFLPSFKDSVGEASVLELSRKYAKNDKFFQELLASVAKRVSGQDLVKILDGELMKKNLIFAFAKEDIESNLRLSGVSNSLLPQREIKDGVVDDFLGVLEENFGKPANNIGRAVDYKVKIGENGEVNSTVSYSIKNNEENPYKTYLKFIVPNSSKLTSIRINGEKKEFMPATTDPKIYEAKNFKPANKLEIKEDEVNGKAVYGFYSEVSPLTPKLIEISYSLPKISLSSLSGFSYFLLFDKQPGVDFYPFSLELNIPPGFKAINFPKGFKNSGSKIIFSKNVATNEDINLNFSKE